MARLFKHQDHYYVADHMADVAEYIRAINLDEITTNTNATPEEVVWGPNHSIEPASIEVVVGRFQVTIIGDLRDGRAPGIVEELRKYERPEPPADPEPEPFAVAFQRLVFGRPAEPRDFEKGDEVGYAITAVEDGEVRTRFQEGKITEIIAIEGKGVLVSLDVGQGPRISRGLSEILPIDARFPHFHGI